MFDVERKEKILQILRAKKSCSVTALADELHFSPATIRRDLNALDAEFKVKKTFGGAVIREEYGSEVPISLRQGENIEAKRALCKECAGLIKENFTIFLPASSTVEQIIPFISGISGLTVITNNPDIPKLLSNTKITVYSTGGRYLHYSNSFVGEYAREMIRNINADLVIFSARGLSYDGKVTNSSTDDDVVRAMIKNSTRSCLLVTEDRVGKTYPFTICDVRNVDIVISQGKLPDNLRCKQVITIKK